MTFCKRPSAGAQTRADCLSHLWSAGNRPGGIVAQVEKRLAGKRTPVKVSILGCVVNGPGEAREADLGIAAGKGKGVIFKRGEIVRHVLEKDMVDALLEEIDKWKPRSARRALWRQKNP